MSVSRKPVSAPARAKRTTYSLVEGERKDHRGLHTRMLTIRMPVDLAEKMEKQLKFHPARMSRNSFIVDAIAQKVAAAPPTRKPKALKAEA